MTVSIGDYLKALEILHHVEAYLRRGSSRLSVYFVSDECRIINRACRDVLDAMKAISGESSVKEFMENR